MGDQTQQAPPATTQTADPEAMDRSAAQSDPYGQPQGNGQPRPGAPAYGVPPQITLKPGTMISVRTNQALSSDHNHIGDTFTAVLMQPVIADGVIVANRGTLAYGRVTEAAKHHGDQDSRLGLELTGITLADGTQAMIHTQLIAKAQYQAPNSNQRGTVVGTAPASASAGATGSPANVLMTHDHETSLYPQTALTLTVTAPATINTAASAQAFRFAGPDDYPNATRPVNSGPRPAGSSSYVYGPPPAYGYPYPYYYPYYPYYWGPSIGFGFGFGGFGGFRGRWR